MLSEESTDASAEVRDVEQVNVPASDDFGFDLVPPREEGEQQVSFVLAEDVVRIITRRLIRTRTEGDQLLRLEVL